MQKYVGFITKNLVEKVGFEAKKDDSELQKMLRIDLMKWACRAGVEKCTQYATKQYDWWLEDTAKNRYSGRQ